LPEGPAAALSAVLDLPDTIGRPGAPLPPLWQWLYFLSWPARRELGPDGHPLDGHFLPPVPDRQRMWAGGRSDITRPLRLGTPTTRVSSLVSVAAKHGRTGELLFVTERREFRQEGRVCLVEEQDIVYRTGRSTGRHPHEPNGSASPRIDSPWSLRLRPDPTLLFRISALTANTHRIHYDVPYCRDIEGYPGVVVHGPLLALLMLELPRRHAPDRQVRSLSYRLRSPVFAGEHLAAWGTPAGDSAELGVATHREARHATAKVVFA
jgi:3-methylfumaryl-CoA hydratase